MDVQRLTDEAVGKAVRWYVADYRKTLIAVAVGVVSVIAGTTYLIIRYTQKRRKEEEDKSEAHTCTANNVTVQL